jgi:hypothetical protein
MEMSDSRARYLLLFEKTGPDNQAVYAGVTSDLGSPSIIESLIWLILRLRKRRKS